MFSYFVFKFLQFEKINLIKNFCLYALLQKVDPYDDMTYDVMMNRLIIWKIQNKTGIQEETCLSYQVIK